MVQDCLDIHDVLIESAARAATINKHLLLSLNIPVGQWLVFPPIL